MRGGGAHCYDNSTGMRLIARPIVRKAQHRAVFVGLTLDVSLPIVRATTLFRRDCVRSEARARFALCASPPLL